jgi:UDP:flavonoid glycosyltransferase YjiC (YdhE family)
MKRTPPAPLVEFLDSGPPPVYVGFGSMSSRNPAETADLVLEAVARTQQRAIIHAGWGGLQRADLPGSVMMVDGVPFSWLFPRVAAVVHHGGAGTTGLALHAGVPAIVVPFTVDQPFWGSRVAALGVGPTPIPRKRLTQERLADALRSTVADEAMRARAVALGVQIRAEDGVAAAVDIFGRFASKLGSA